MKKIKSFAIVSAVLALSACSEIPSSAFFSRGQPESLLSVSTESVVVDVSKGTTQLASIINRKEPNSATVTCSSKAACSKATEVLDQFGIAFEVKTGAGNKVALNYENISARDCDNRFISNTNNPYNLNHPGFGCSLAVNQVLAVGDKRQFTDPLILGPYDGQKATQNFDGYLSKSSSSGSGRSVTISTGTTN